jgi:DNA invertase Pin-like site-specific DNA recombinase
MQREASIDDQIRVCTAHLERDGRSVVETYADHAVSGATALRSGYQALLADARAKRFDLVIAESLDRFSRDQEHIAAFYKLMSFAGIAVVTLAEGTITELHVGLKGTMSALFLKDLAQKTHRGLEGRVRAGRSAGGLSYGYRVQGATRADGAPSNGLRAVEESEAEVVRRIFTDYAGGLSPRTIARAEQRQRSGSASWEMDRVAPPWERHPRNRDPPQSPLCRRARVEPPALRQGSDDQQASCPTQSSRLLDHRACAFAADH